MLDGIIGIVAGDEPMYCAATGQEVRGRHANTYAIEGTHAYYRVLAKAVETWDSNPENHANLVKDYKASRKAPIVDKSETVITKEVK